MPPIPPTFDADAQDLIASTSRLINDISEYQIPRLRDCKGPLSVQQQLANEVREDLDKLGRQIQELDVLVGDQQGERNRMMLKQVVEEKMEELNRLKKESRAALLASKRVIDSMNLSNREELLQSAAGKQQTVEGKGKSREDTLMEANNNVTEGLRRTIGLMQGELERSVLTVQMLESSTKTLHATSTAHDTLTFTMDTSKTLIAALAKSDWQDRALIIAGLVFFLCVVLLIVKERVLDRSIRLAFWWTRFIPDFSGDKELLKMEEMLGATTVAASVSSVLSSAASEVTATLESLTATTSEDEPLQTMISEVLSSTLSGTSTDPESTPTSSTIDDTHTHEEL
ncbi:Sec20-domain-containing protein [Moniliophthora roreri MCA 2997]|uniref:Sec20-domain-containing protein n=1 Tax=Moniliophthora roreri (strain MCA 2997) TaxID=1381753 RepID=V2WW83_MONRO|nr:Sec20-domain-containing protein [Moniliophthora roreri MCA 2997]